MPPGPPLELRVEVYTEGNFPVTLAERIGALPSQRWPVEWDVNLPPHVSFDHPAEWHAVVLLPEGVTPETAHREIARDFLALDPTHSLHFRTRWDFPQAPDQREVYEEHWRPKRR